MTGLLGRLAYAIDHIVDGKGGEYNAGGSPHDICPGSTEKPFKVACCKHCGQRTQKADAKYADDNERLNGSLVRPIKLHARTNFCVFLQTIQQT